jgi:hypothetical protein
MTHLPSFEAEGTAVFIGMLLTSPASVLFRISAARTLAVGESGGLANEFQNVTPIPFIGCSRFS